MTPKKSKVTKVPQHNLHEGTPVCGTFSVRARVEMALIDAAANSIGIPLWRLFGGVSNSISTDITKWM
ncbi:hypothetical protein K7X08_024132 [Anisodus acutangulus]|uniref:Uncharacterized protein n=1 Tax=Anisodus acutangulus TaxID=402998 RepID=A0A9Q1MA84_9SOLA|nr:hypothetical protein K7X08_024132 [Anisodus acutangulus]